MLLRVIFLCFIIGLGTRSTMITGICEQVLDGDTVIINGEKIRLFGIDAPELSQKSFDKIKIGELSKKYLEELILNKRVQVKIKGVGIYKRKLGIIYFNGLDINKLLLLKGHALISSIQTYERYETSQREAWLNKRGVFSTKGLLTPRYYRKLNLP